MGCVSECITYKTEQIPLQHCYSKTVFGYFAYPLSLSQGLRTCQGNHWDAEYQNYFPFKYVREFRSVSGEKKKPKQN